jgi:predicted amidophosphoribosyltransferase
MKHIKDLLPDALSDLDRRRRYELDGRLCIDCGKPVENIEHDTCSRCARELDEYDNNPDRWDHR